MASTCVRAGDITTLLKQLGLDVFHRHAPWATTTLASEICSANFLIEPKLKHSHCVDKFLSLKQ